MNTNTIDINAIAQAMQLMQMMQGLQQPQVKPATRPIDSTGQSFTVVRTLRAYKATSGIYKDKWMLCAGDVRCEWRSALVPKDAFDRDGATQTVRMLRWTMGGLDGGGGYVPVLTLLPWVLIASGVLAWHCRELDLFSMGEELAQARGVAVSRVQTLLLVTASFMVAAIVSVCGPIGFLGLMVPHIMRRLVGARHVILVPAVFLGGAILLILCDTFARTVIFPDEIPVGILTALLGGPFFLAIFVRK